MMASKRQAAHHYFSVFIDLPGAPELAWFGYSERIAAWQFYKAVRVAARKPGAYHPGKPELAWFGYSERIAAWQFYKAVRVAARKPGAYAVDLRQDGQELASVPIKTPAIA